jgi:signal transduction histidine kinase/CheY-like chemotaxis protein
MLAKIKAAFASGEPWEDTFRLRQHDGQMCWHLSRMLPVRDVSGKIMRWFGTNTDISKARQMEQDLEEKAGELAVVSQRKSEFLATLAHELRNPLAPLRSGLELLDVTDDHDTLVEVRAMMRRQVDQMVLLVDDLMDLNRISRGAITLRNERIDVRSMIHQAVESTGGMIEKHGHTLILDLPVKPAMVVADGMRLVQVFSNLLNNAAKYTDAGGKITVQVRSGPATVSIAVIDNGIGLAADQLNKVFEMFAQVERGTDRVQGGLGIGLNIVRQLVEMHGGSIAVGSEGLNKGSVFTVQLPNAEPVAEAVIPAKIPAPPASQAVKHRILVVDDNTDAAFIMAWLLQKLGHEVHKAENGKDALLMGEEFKPEIVIMDIGMPVMNGHEACKLMRRTEWGRVACIIALTGLGAEEDRHRSSDAGFDHHLVKPVGRDALVEVIGSARVK